MGISVVVMKLCHVAIRRLLIVGVFVAVIVVFQCCWTAYYSLLDAGGSSVALPIKVFLSGTSQQEGVFRSTAATNVMFNVTFASHSKEYASEKEADLESDGGTSSREGSIPNKGFKVASHHEDAIYSYTQKRPKYADLSTSDMLLAVKKPSNESIIQSVEMKSQNENAQVLKSPLSKSNSKPKMGTSSTSSKLVWPTSITQMNSLMLQSFNSSASMRPRWSSRRDRELLSAKLEIENAHVMSNSSGLYASIFWDVSKFSRSYELMERKLKVFIYREGAKPIFQQPKMRGIYASEGWFMKLMEGNKR